MTVIASTAPGSTARGRETIGRSSAKSRAPRRNASDHRAGERERSGRCIEMPPANARRGSATGQCAPRDAALRGCSLASRGRRRRNAHFPHFDGYGECGWGVIRADRRRSGASSSICALRRVRAFPYRRASFDAMVLPHILGRFRKPAWSIRTSRPATPRRWSTCGRPSSREPASPARMPFSPRWRGTRRPSRDSVSATTRSGRRCWSNPTRSIRWWWAASPARGWWGPIAANASTPRSPSWWSTVRWRSHSRVASRAPASRSRGRSSTTPRVVCRGMRACASGRRAMPP